MKIVRASWVLPVSRPPIRDGAVAVDGSRIGDVGQRRDIEVGPDDTVEVLDGYALAPAFVNAHAHLGLSHLKGKVPYPGTFAGWLRRLAPTIGLASQRRIRRSVRDGLDQASRSGTALVADVLVRGIRQQTTDIGHQTSDIIPFFEVLGWDRARYAGAIKAAERFISHQSGSACGISPHAPYSTSPDLYRWAAAAVYAPRPTSHVPRPTSHLLLGTHAAETREEIEFLKTGRGPLRDLLEAFHIAPRDWEPPGISPVEYLASLGVLGPRTLLFHGNYLTDEDIAIIAHVGASVVFCPQSHRFFGHEPHPLPRLLRAGVRVCLGTDSLASNWSLDMRGEMARVRESFPEVEPGRVLAMATLSGAAALGMEGRLGSIEPGKEAALVALRLPDSADPYSGLFPEGECLNIVHR